MLLAVLALAAACGSEAPCDPCPGAAVTHTDYCGEPGYMTGCYVGQTPDLTTYACTCSARPTVTVISGELPRDAAGCARVQAAFTSAGGCP